MWLKFAREPFEKIADEYHVDYALVDYRFDSRRFHFSAQAARLASMPPRSPQAERLLGWWREHGGWHLVYWDDICAVYVDGSEKFRSTIEQFAYELVDPTVGDPGYLAGYLRDPTARQVVIDEVHRAVAQAPHSKTCRALRDWLVQELRRRASPE